MKEKRKEKINIKIIGINRVLNKLKTFNRRAILISFMVLLIVVFFTYKYINSFIIVEDEPIPFGKIYDCQIETKWNNKKYWNLVWQDEFNGKGLPDERKWQVQEYNRRNNDNGPDGWWTKDQVNLDGKGNLVISANKIENRNNDEDPYDYSTGMIRSLGFFEQTYGKYEIRCKLPSQKGWWVAFWLNSNDMTAIDGTGNDGAEIDVFEAFGWSDIIHHTVHWDGYGKDHKSTSKYVKINKIHDEFHTYSLIWTPTEYQFYIDGKLSWVTKGGGVSHVPQYIKITGEIAATDALASEHWANKPSEAKFPDYFIVDYVKVYEYLEKGKQ